MHVSTLPQLSTVDVSIVNIWILTRNEVVCDVGVGAGSLTPSLSLSHTLKGPSGGRGEEWYEGQARDGTTSLRGQGTGLPHRHPETVLE
jgi:hypothetical protein